MSDTETSAETVIGTAMDPAADPAMNPAMDPVMAPPGDGDGTGDREPTGRERGARGVGGTAGYVWSVVDDAPVREVFPGIRVRPLWTGDDGAKAQVLEMDPGSCWEGIDVHAPGPEEVFVVSGTFHDGEGDHPAGSFLHAPAGSWHVPQSAAGCTLFVFYPEG